MENLASLGRRWGEERGEILALRCGSEDRTWREIDSNSDALSRGLVAQGVGQGDRVGLLVHNCPAIPEIVIATLKIGAIVVPLNVMLTRAELTPLLNDAGCAAVVTEAALVERLPAECGSAPMVFSVDGGGPEPLDSLRASGPPFRIADVDQNDPAFICYTSGTTGRQKGAVLSHGNLHLGAMAKIRGERLTGDDRFLVPVQLVYTGAMISVFMQLVYHLGATMILEQEFEPDRCLELIERERITTMSGVPVVYERMALSPEFDRRDISSLRSLSAGGSPVSSDLLDKFQRRGIPMIQGYGMTETSGYATTLPFEHAADHLGSAGLPVSGSEIAIVDENSCPLGPGEVGEVVIRGSHVMAGYWNQPELTDEVLKDGWLHSGDLGFIDTGGFLFIVDRKKDMLISGGHNVYPAEIENALAGVDGVEELAVIGVPDEKWGETPLLVFRTAKHAKDAHARLGQRARDELAAFKRPRRAIEIDGPLPRTVAGKVSKPDLRARYPRLPEDAIHL